MQVKSLLLSTTHLLKTPLTRSTLAVLGLLACAGITQGAGFTPIALDPTSYNADPVIERTAPKALNDYVTVTPDQGTNKNGNTWYEVGYMTNTTGLPAHNSLVSTNNAGTTRSYTFQMPPDYTVNNCIFLGHQNGAINPILHPQGGTPGTFTLTTPHPYNSISVLNGSGNGACVIYYVIHFSDGTTQTGTFSSTDWWSGNASSGPITRVYDAQGLVSMGGGINNQSANHGVLWANDIDLNNTTANVTSVDFSWQYGSSNGHSPWGNGRTVIFGLAGSTDAVLGGAGTFSPVAVTGFDQDVVMEASGPQTTGTSPDTNVTTVLITNNNYITVSMDGNVGKGGSTWYEAGYYSAYPNSGVPQAGTSITSLSKPEIQYNLPSTYVGNCTYFLNANTNVNQATIKFTTPTAAGSLAFLVGGGNGGLNVRAEIQFQGGATETNWISAPDWFERTVNQPAYVCFGRMSPSNRSINNSPDQFRNAFLPINQIGGVPIGNLPTPLPFYRDPRNGGAAFPNLPPVRLFDSVFPVVNSSTPISSINLYCTNTSGGNCITIFSVSGSPGMPPIISTHPFTIVSGTDSITNGSARQDNIILTKAYQGIDNVTLVVSNIVNTASDNVSYQWKRAPRGGGWRDINLSDYDMSTFANVTGPNINVASGANFSILTISNATLADSADYLAVLSNANGSQTSFVATVMILTTNANLLVGQVAGDTITKWSADGTSANGQETFTSAIDQKQQKWLSTGLGGLALDGTTATGAGNLPWSTQPAGGGQPGIGYIVTPINGKSICTSLRFYCANDTVGRDPFDYNLEGSNDGTTWSRIAGGALAGTLMLPTGRDAGGSLALDPLGQPVVEVDFANAVQYASYRITITNIIDGLGTTLMQVGEIQMLGTPIPTAPSWVRQPVPSVTVFAGSSPTWGVQAVGAPPPRYQWFTNSGAGPVAVPGATGHTFTLTNVQSGQEGITVSCTASNLGGGPILSSSSILHVIPAPTQSYPAAVLANNPIGYWRLDEGPDNGFGNDGVVTHDYAGGHNGTYSNVVLQVTGYNTNSDPNTAAAFGQNNVLTDSYVDNIDDVDFARGTNTAGATFSVETWVYGGNETANAGIVTKGYYGILALGTGTGTEQFALDYPAAGFRFIVRDFFGNGYAAQSSVRSADPTTGFALWHHLVGVCDQPNGHVYLYVDGLLAGQGTIPSNVGILSQPLPMTIGARKSTQANDYDQLWVGTIDDVAVYATALTAAQVQTQFYGAQLPPLFSLQPVSVHTNANVLMALTSYAYGPSPITYQWYNSDGFSPTTALGGQTSSNYTFTSTAGQNGLSYQVVAQNTYGSVTSLVSTLTIESGIPSFVFQDLPPAQTVFIGHIIQLHVAPSGTAPFTYQWMRNGSPVSNDYRTSGAQTDTLTIGYATNSDSGNYFVQVSNGSGSNPSTTDALTVTTNTGGFFGAGSTTADWQLNNSSGNPAILYPTNAVELTHNLGNTANSAFLLTKQNVTSFKAAFVYQFVQGTGGADGVSFCIQNDSRGATAAGGGGGGLAVSGITPSLALELNIYSPNTFGIALNQNGATGNYTSISPVLLGQNSNPIRVDVAYDGTTLQTKFTDQVALTTFSQNFTVNIPTIVSGNTAYVGFTGADGGVNSTQIVSWNTGGSAATPFKLNFARSGNNLILSWPSKNGGFLLHKPTLGAPWAVDQTDTFSVVGANSTVTVPLQSAAGQFFSLQIWP